MGKIVCQYGYEHGRCRCTSNHVETRPCSTPDKHKPESNTHGEWIKANDNAHDCVKPTYFEAKNAKEGDQWRCHVCAAEWEISRVRKGFDVRPGEGEYGWFNWKIIKTGNAL